MALEQSQLGAIEALCAEAEPIDARFAEHRADIRASTVAGLHSTVHSFTPRQIEPLAQPVDQPPHLIERQQRRRAAAEEDRPRPRHRPTGWPIHCSASRQHQIDEPRPSALRVWRVML